MQKTVASPTDSESLVAEGLAAEPGELVTDEWWDEFDTEVFGHPIGEKE